MGVVVLAVRYRCRRQPGRAASRSTAPAAARRTLGAVHAQARGHAAAHAGRGVRRRRGRAGGRETPSASRRRAQVPVRRFRRLLLRRCRLFAFFLLARRRPGRRPVAATDVRRRGRRNGNSVPRSARCGAARSRRSSASFTSSSASTARSPSKSRKSSAMSPTPTSLAGMPRSCTADHGEAGSGCPIQLRHGEARHADVLLPASSLVERVAAGVAASTTSCGIRCGGRDLLLQRPSDLVQLGRQRAVVD